MNICSLSGSSTWNFKDVIYHLEEDIRCLMIVMYKNLHGWIHEQRLFWFMSSCKTKTKQIKIITEDQVLFSTHHFALLFHYTEDMFFGWSGMDQQNPNVILI